MIIKYKTPEERRNTRIKLYKDDVFLIAQETLNQLETSIPMEELFASADQFTNFLLDNDLSERDTIQYEINDLREEISDDQTFYVLLSLSFVKLCALRKVKSNAENVARALVGFCQEYDGFTDLLKKFQKKEKAMWFENKRADLLTYELKCIEKGVPTIDGLKVVSSIVDAASEGLSADNILPVEIALAEVDDKLEGHPFQHELNRLREARHKKSVANIKIERLNDIHDNSSVTIGSKEYGRY